MRQFWTVFKFEFMSFMKNKTFVILIINMKVCSMIPFTSPMAMFARIAMSTVSVIEIVTSIVILIVSTIIIGIGAAKIYRAGVTLYGNAPSFKKVIGLLKKQA